MQCIIAENTLIKLSHYDETCGPSQRHASGINPRVKALR